MTCSRRLLLATLVVVVAAGTILPGLSALEPHLYAPDTIAAVDQTLRMLSGRTPFPRRFTKGGNLHLYLLAGIFLPRYARLPATRAPDPDSPSAFASDPRWPTLRKHLNEFFLLARSLSATLGLLTVLVLFEVGRRLGGMRTGFLSGLGLGVSLVFVHTAHLGTEDVLGVFLLVLFWYYLIEHLQDGRAGSFRAACLTAGLAISAKASHGLLLLPLVLSAGFPPRRAARPPGAGRRMAFGVLLVAGAYLVTTPSLLVYPVQYVKDVAMETSRRWAYRGFRMREPGWWFQTAQLADAVGLPMFLFLMGGLTATLRRWVAGALSRAEGLLLLYGAVYFAVVGSWDTASVFYLVPLVPLLIPLAVRRWEGVLAAGKHPLLWHGLLTLVLGFSAWYAAGAVGRFRTDARREATRWLAGTLPAGASVDVFSQRVYLPEFPGFVRVRRYVTRGGPNDAWERGRRRLEALRPDYLVLSSNHYERYLRDPKAYPDMTRFYRRLLTERTPYRIQRVFGPPVTLDVGSERYWRESLTPRALFPIDPTVVILRREHPRRSSGGNGPRQSSSGSAVMM